MNPNDAPFEGPSEGHAARTEAGTTRCEASSADTSSHRRPNQELNPPRTIGFLPNFTIPKVADRDAKDIRSQVAKRLAPVSDRLRVDVPGFRPDFFRDPIERQARGGRGLVVADSLDRCADRNSVLARSPAGKSGDSCSGRCDRSSLAVRCREVAIT